MSKKCYHCGLDCKEETLVWQDKYFCCNGCKTVFEILSAQNLTNFYNLNNTPGIKPKHFQSHEFEYLNQPNIQEKLLLFNDENTSVIEFYIPVIHCSSCVWVLENLQKIEPAISFSQVNFTKKRVQITYNNTQIHLQELAEFLTKLGYKPIINLENESSYSRKESTNKELIIQLAVAGFCFGNVMLFAFPDYFLNQTDVWYEQYKWIFRGLMFLLSLPVVFYSAKDYFKSAITGIKYKNMNIDIPISIGIAILFLRSTYEAAWDISSGYFDSLCGLVFFMLVGKYFQQTTYKSLSFDRDYRSFYPLSVTKIIDETEQKPVLLSELKPKDRILIRNQEMIPADAILIEGKGFIDNSFITGESNWVEKNTSDKVFAGGTQNGGAIVLEIIKNVNQSYLTQLWQKAGKETDNSGFSSLINTVSKYFTPIVLALAIIGGLVWYFINPDKMFLVITSVLIVACPCALALSTPFTLGNTIRILARKNIFTKNISVIEKLNKITHIVFDKTGTLTNTQNTSIQYIGEELTEEEKECIRSITQNSSHPLSRKLMSHLTPLRNSNIKIENFKEEVGKGMSANIKNTNIKIGSAAYMGVQPTTNETSIYVSFNETVKGAFVFTQTYRKNIGSIIKQLPNIDFSVVSGDNSGQKNILEKLLGIQKLYFNQTPKDKYNHITSLQKQQQVMMVGDGINDSAALQKSDVGIAITEDVNNFTPASDVIMNGKNLYLLPKLLRFSKKSVKLVKISMLISLLYNVIGLSFALGGILTPLVAAILMPISSISVVLFATVSTWYVGNSIFKNEAT